LRQICASLLWIGSDRELIDAGFVLDMISSEVVEAAVGKRARQKEPSFTRVPGGSGSWGSHKGTLAFAVDQAKAQSIMRHAVVAG
jgi:hypothetical protein